MLTEQKNNNKKLVPLRIKQARTARECTLDDLAADIGVSKQMVSRYESNISKPDIETVIQIAYSLDFPIEFFYKPIIQSIAETSPVFFRSTIIPKKTQDAMEQKIGFAFEIVNYIEKYIQLPLFENKISVNSLLFLEEPWKEIEELSLKLRKIWELGEKPINNLTNLLLRKGYIITRSHNNRHQVDAFSKLYSKPYIILGADKNCCVRSRFDLAHELGHTIMHFGEISNDDKKKYHKTLEKHSNRFASAFLMPAASFSNDIDNVSLESFIYLKKKWKVSIAAMVRRCYDLKIIDEYQYTSLNKSISKRGWKQREPLDDTLEYEVPGLFQQAFDLLFNKNIISPDECLMDIAINPMEIENICFLKNGYFTNTTNVFQKPKLRVVK